MTGCQSLEIVFDALIKIFKKLSETKAIIKKKNKIMVVEEKPFSEHTSLFRVVVISFL